MTRTDPTKLADTLARLRTTNLLRELRGRLHGTDPARKTQYEVEYHIANAVRIMEPYYSVWMGVLNTIVRQYAPEADELIMCRDSDLSTASSSPGTIWVGTELVMKHGVPLEEILAAAALCFAGAPTPLQSSDDGDPPL